MAEELWAGRSELQELCSRVFITNFFGAKNCAKLNACGITHVLVCAKELDCVFQESGLHYMKLPLADNPAERIDVHFASAFAFVDAALQREDCRVLFHCAGGGSRSAAMVLGYMLHRGTVSSLEEALHFARARRPIIEPNIGFIEQLEVYSRDRDKNISAHVWSPRDAADDDPGAQGLGKSDSGKGKSSGKGRRAGPPPPPAGAMGAKQEAARAAAGRAEEARQRREDMLKNGPRHRPRIPGPGDPFDLRHKFCNYHQTLFSEALREIRAGQKRTCWSWWIFPVPPFVVDGVERGSEASQRYALRDLPPHADRGDDAALAFLRFEADGVSLRGNYLAIMSAATQQLEQGVKPATLVGCLDDPKLRTSLRLFERVSRAGVDTECNEVCARALRALGEPTDP